MSKPLACADVPCGSCPYRQDTPPGVWAAEEYVKLREYAHGDPVPALSVFLCHQTNANGVETVCRGWLTVEQESIAVRLALAQGLVTGEQVYAEPRIALYESGEEAARAGLAAVPDPSPKAMRLGQRLLKKGAAKGYDNA